MAHRLNLTGDFFGTSLSDGEEPMTSAPILTNQCEKYSSAEFPVNRLQRKKAIKHKRNKTTNFTSKLSLPCEYFTVRIDGANDSEILPALESTPLQLAVSKWVEGRGLRMDGVEFFLENSSSALPSTCDTFHLANKTIIIKTKNLSKEGMLPILKTTDRSRQFSNPNSPRLINGDRKIKSSDDIYQNDVSPIGSVTSFFSESKFKLGTRKKLQSLLSTLSIKPSDKMDQLTENLINYTTKGLPQLPALLSLGRPNFKPNQFVIESHWTKIVANHENLGHAERQHQEAIWELMVTELNYISRLKVVVDLFVSCLFDLQNDLLLNEIEVEKCFGRIVDVYFSQCIFWIQAALPCLTHSRETRNILSISHFKEAFQEFEETFDACVRFCLEQENLGNYFKTTLKNNEMFRYFIAWAEFQPQCKRLTFLDLIAEPLMRLTKYQLLFVAIRKPLNKMAAVDRKSSETDDFVVSELETVEIMIEKVVGLTTMTNSLMMKRQDLNQLSCLINRIESYEISDNNEEIYAFLSRYSDLDLTQAIAGCSRTEPRVVLLEGNLKLKDGAAGKVDVVCVLLTDVILIGRNVMRRCDRLKIIRPPIRIDHAVVHELKDGQSFLLVQLTECGLFQTYYLLFGDAKLWIKKIEKARDLYAEKRCQFREQKTVARDDVSMTSRDSFKSQRSHLSRSAKMSTGSKSNVSCFEATQAGEKGDAVDAPDPLFDAANFFPWHNWDAASERTRYSGPSNDNGADSPYTEKRANASPPRIFVNDEMPSVAGGNIMNIDELIDRYLEYDCLYDAQLSPGARFGCEGAIEGLNSNGTVADNYFQSALSSSPGRIQQNRNSFRKSRNVENNQILENGGSNIFLNTNLKNLVRTSMHLNI